MLCIPPEFELSGNEVLIHRVGERLIVNPVPKKKTGLLEILAGLGTFDVEFADTDEEMLPLDDIRLQSPAR